MASWAGALGQEFGGMMQDRSADMREERMKDEDFAREQQLAKQRMAFENKQLNVRMSAEDKRAARSIQANKALETSRQSFETGYREADREADTASDKLKSDTDILTAAMAMYISDTNSGYARGNDWTTKVEKSIDMQTGQPTETIYATHGPATYRQIGDKFFDAAGPTEAYPFESIEQQRAAESKLHDGTVTMQKFKDDFGYIPLGYVTGEVARGSDFGSFVTRNRIPLLGFELAGDDRRGGGGPRTGDPKVDKMYQEQGVSRTDEPMRPSVDQMSDNSKRDANIAAKGDTNENLAADYRATGAPSGSFYDGSYLTQGQAAAGEMPAPLETGGQLGPTKAAAAAGRLPPLPGGELDDAGAAELASVVSEQMLSPWVHKVGEFLGTYPGGTVEGGGN